MKKGLLLSVIALASLSHATDVVFDGQVRYRMENANFTPGSPPPFDNDVDAFNHSLLRTRLGATITPQDGLKIYIQAQDSRHIGDMALGTSGTTTNDDNLGLHQGYFSWNCQVLSGLSIKAGRFELARADQRFFGAVDWSNVGRSFDGWLLNYDVFGLTNVDVYGLKLMEAEAYKMDETAWGLYFNNILGMRVDLFWNNHDHGQNLAGDADAFSTIGAHYDNTYYDKLGVNVNFGTQMGTDEIADLEYTGMMYSLDLDYKLGLGILDKVGFGYESVSADDPDTGDYGWQELYPTAHKFNGYMDIAAPMAAELGVGLNDIQLNLWGTLPMGMAYKLDYHMFSFVEDVPTVNTLGIPGGNTDCGSEIDLSLAKKMDNFGVNLGYSMFMPTDNIAPNGDSQSWMYLMLTAGF